MAVILADGGYSVRRRPHEYPRDAHGVPVPTDPAAAAGPMPGGATEQPDGSYTLRLDPALWPVRADDLIDGPGGRTWLVETAVLRANTADAAIDYVAVAASLEPPRRA